MKVITVCWVATHVIEIYYNVGNLQLFSPHAQEWRVYVGRQVCRIGLILFLYPFIFSTFLNSFDQIKH